MRSRPSGGYRYWTTAPTWGPTTWPWPTSSSGALTSTRSAGGWPPWARPQLDAEGPRGRARLRGVARGAGAEVGRSARGRPARRQWCFLPLTLMRKSLLAEVLPSLAELRNARWTLTGIVLLCRKARLPRRVVLSFNVVRPVVAAVTDPWA